MANVSQGLINLALMAAAAAAVLGMLVFWGIPGVKRRLERLLGESPRTGITELFFSLQATTLREMMLTLQRATTGKPANHPMGSPMATPWLDEFGWDPATLDPPARPRGSAVALAARLGPRAHRPLRLEFPVLIAPMGYGIALNWATKVALAQASALTGIATNSGEGPFLPAERAYAARWVLQFGRGPWNHQSATIRLADMVEIQLGQGSEADTGVRKSPQHLPRRIRQATDHPERTFRIHGGIPFSLRRVVARIRRLNPEVPVGVKIPASDHLEHDIARLLGLKIDVLTVDGAEAASSSSPAVISDHFGLGCLEAVVRADVWLKALGQREHVSLVASGGVRGADDIAKLLALGADAVAVGSALLMAASHGQVHRVVPRFGPTRLVLASPQLSPRDTLDVDMAAIHAVNWLKATQGELGLIAQAAGVAGLDELGPQHLIPRTARARALLAYAKQGGAEEGFRVLVEVWIRHYGILNRTLTRLLDAAGRLWQPTARLRR
ncbi:MAG: glutamate synthase-related protein [Firmicutes bacterium]|nr:glutamate synthase-related protein [Bacillota bacterium]